MILKKNGTRMWTNEGRVERKVIETETQQTEKEWINEWKNASKYEKNAPNIYSER